ncbi:uncharacterized protein VTP21DRAFT_3898 [Calcarisporiella thermophila]|uniref:uncharacterized protein n=1 Tax=Calcarisporiella thermophila TaxID=911321 RepID=UPI003742F01A
MSKHDRGRPPLEASKVATSSSSRSSSLQRADRIPHRLSTPPISLCLQKASAEQKGLDEPAMARRSLSSPLPQQRDNEREKEKEKKKEKEGLLGLLRMKFKARRKSEIPAPITEKPAAEKPKTAEKSQSASSKTPSHLKRSSLPLAATFSPPRRLVDESNLREKMDRRTSYLSTASSASSTATRSLRPFPPQQPQQPYQRHSQDVYQGRKEYTSTNSSLTGLSSSDTPSTPDYSRPRSATYGGESFKDSDQYRDYVDAFGDLNDDDDDDNEPLGGVRRSLDSRGYHRHRSMIGDDVVLRPDSLLAAHLSERLSAREQAELARQTGHTLVKVPKKPPEPSAGLVGAIANRQRERSAPSHEMSDRVAKRASLLLARQLKEQREDWERRERERKERERKEAQEKEWRRSLIERQKMMLMQQQQQQQQAQMMMLMQQQQQQQQQQQLQQAGMAGFWPAPMMLLPAQPMLASGGLMSGGMHGWDQRPPVYGRKERYPSYQTMA